MDCDQILPRGQRLFLNLLYGWIVYKLYINLLKYRNKCLLQNDNYGTVMLFYQDKGSKLSKSLSHLYYFICFIYDLFLKKKNTNWGIVMYFVTCGVVYKQLFHLLNQNFSLWNSILLEVVPEKEKHTGVPQLPWLSHSCWTRTQSSRPVQHSVRKYIL